MPTNRIDLIGQNADDDWQLRPLHHATALPTEAGALKRILESARLQEIMAEFKKADAKAVLAQKWYRFWGRAGLYAIALASIIGTAFVLRVDEMFGVTSKWLALTLEYGLLVAAFLIAQWLVLKQPFQKWMEARGRAEILRIQIFDEIVAADEPVREEEAALLPLQLEYFRRYQLDVQQAYYAGRGGQHERAAGRSTQWQWISVILTLLWAAIAGIAALHFFSEQGWMRLPEWVAALKLGDYERWVMALGIVAASVYTASYARSLMDLDERNAARYATTLANLEHIRKTLLAPSRAAAERDEKDKVRAFVALVQKQISSEHQEWITLRDIAPDANALLAHSGAPVIVRRAKN